MTPRRSTPTRRLLALILATTLGIGLPVQAPRAQVSLPALGESAAEDLTVGAERRLGDQIMRDIRRDPDYIDDPVLLDYLNSIWQPLVAAARQRGDIDVDIERQFNWEAFLVRDRSVNAFALPGGFVGVHLGLIAMTTSRDELASVLAHELSHVTQRHIARSMVNSQKASLLSLGAIILGILAASRSNNADMAQAAIVGGQAAAVQGQLNFSRDMEREADRIGFGVLTSAGFDSRGMAAMFEKLDLANRLNDNGSFPYLRTHPLTVDRISEARSRVMLGGGTATSPWVHALMQARARALMDPGVDSLRRQADAGARLPAAAPERLGLLYGSAVAASRLREPQLAQASLDQVLREWRELQPRPQEIEPLLRLLEAETRLARGDAAGSIKLVDGLGPAAGSRSALLLRAQAALDLQRQDNASAETLRQSVEALQVWVSTHPHDAAAWAQLGSSADALGMRLRSLRAQAEQRAALGDITGAIDRLRAGRAQARGPTGQDFIEASIIDSRLRELEGLRRQLAADARGSRGNRDDDGANRP